jgi:hypothetical protein
MPSEVAVAKSRADFRHFLRCVIVAHRAVKRLLISRGRIENRQKQNCETVKL